MRETRLLVVGLAVLVGCAPAASGTLGPDYFKHNESGYELIYLGDGPADALGPGWQLDNYRLAPARGGAQAYFVREDEGYGFDRRYDFDGDGLTDHSVRRATYDLRFTQQAGQGVLWTRSLILADSLKDKSLATLAQRYVSKVPRVGAVFPHFGEGLPTGVATAPYSVEVLAEYPACEVANVPAHRIDFELRGDGEPRRVEMVWMRPGYSHSLVANGKTYTYEVILLAAHENTPEAAPTTEPSFDALLDHLSLARGQRPHTCRPGAPPPAVEASGGQLPGPSGTSPAPTTGADGT